MKRIILAISIALSAFTMHAQVDTTRVLCIGNSFTYFYDSHLKLAEIALSQGHYIDMTAVDHICRKAHIYFLIHA